VTERKLGTVTISPGVLATVAKMTTLAIPGVVRMSPTGVDQILSARRGDGVKVQVVDDAVILDLYIVASADMNLLQLSREIQSQVTRAVHDTVGMAVREVNVHVIDVTDSPTPAANPTAEAPRG